MRLTLRTLLAYLDDTLDPARAREIGQKLAASPDAQELVARVQKVTRKRGLATPPPTPSGGVGDPNTVTAYLSDTLPPDAVAQYEGVCLESDVHLAEVAACHQILTLLLCEPSRVPPSAYRRMYGLVTGPESLPHRRPGNIIPVGGARDPHEHDDSDDAAYLLGLSGYTRAEAPGQYAVKAVVGVLLALVAGVGAAAAWPRGGTPAPVATRQEPVSVASAEPPAEEPAPPPKSADAPAPTRPDDLPPRAKPDEVPAVAPPATPPAPAPAAPAPVQPPPPAPAAELPPLAAPRPEVAPVGQLDKRDALAVLARKVPGAVEYSRVAPAEPVVSSGERLVAIPGSKATLQLGRGLRLELWGNVPELLPSHLLESAAVFAAPPAGIDAEFTLETGRAYLSAPEAGRVVRVRAAGRGFDAVSRAPRSELAIELIHGLGAAGPDYGGAFAVTGGAFDVYERAEGQPAGAGVSLTAGREAGFSSAKPGFEARAAEPRAADAYWSRFVVPPDAARAKLTLAALAEFARALDSGVPLPQVLKGGLPSGAEATPALAAKARLSLFAFGALGEIKSLVDSLHDPDRPLSRITAVEALRSAVALTPALADEFRADLAGRYKASDADAAEAVRLLRGLSDEERKNPATAAALAKQLSAESLAVRELAFGMLAPAADAKDAKTLFRYDPAGPLAERREAVKAWEAWAAELGKSAAGAKK